jgi:hypothetical protein
MWEEDGTFAIDYNDSRIFFVEASSPIFVEELQDNKLLHSYENFYPLDHSNIPNIGGLLYFSPFLLHKFEFPKLLKKSLKCVWPKLCMFFKFVELDSFNSRVKFSLIPFKMMFMHFDANLFFLSMFLNINCKYNH